MIHLRHFFSKDLCNAASAQVAADPHGDGHSAERDDLQTFAGRSRGTSKALRIDRHEGSMARHNADTELLPASGGRTNKRMNEERKSERKSERKKRAGNGGSIVGDSTADQSGNGLRHIRSGRRIS